MVQQFEGGRGEPAYALGGEWIGSQCTPDPLSQDELREFVDGDDQRCDVGIASGPDRARFLSEPDPVSRTPELGR